MAFGQVFKKRGNGPGNTGESTFEQNEKTEVPEIEGIMDQITRSLDKTKHVIVEHKEYQTMVEDDCSC